VVGVSEITRKPAVVGTSLAVLAGMCSALSVALGSVTGLALAGPGLLALGVGLLTGGRRTLGAGGTLLVGGVLFAGVQGAGPETLLFGLLTAVLAWDVGEHAIGVGEQLGREADTRRVELVHAGASTFVGVVAAGIGYGAYLGATGGQPVTALVFLLLGAVILVSVLR
jgi:hypothetical protein